MDDMVCWSMTHIQMCGYFMHCYVAIFLHDGFNCCNDLWCHYSVCLTWSRRVCYRTNELTPFRNFLLHSYTCCSDRHASPYWTYIRQWILMGFTPSLRKKRMTEHCSSCACCKWGRHLFYTIAAPSCCVPPMYCHLSATLQTMSITVANLQDNQAVFRIFKTLLRFSFDSPP